MCNRTQGRLILRAYWTGVLAAVVALPTLAAAQERIQGIRLGRHEGYARIVIDVTGGAAYVTSDPAELYVEAEAPTLAPALRGELSALGVRLEGSGPGTRLILDVEAARAWTAFRLGSGSPRIVIDLGSRAPGLPPDAEPLPERPSPLAERPPREAPVTDPVPTPPTDRVPREARVAARGPELRVRASGITFVGLGPDGPDPEELLDLPLAVRLAPSGDWEAALGDSDAQAVTLRQLTASAAGEPALTDSALQQIVERIAEEYARRGRMGTRVDIQKADLEPLRANSGRLVVRINESGAPHE